MVRNYCFTAFNGVFTHLSKLRVISVPKFGISRDQKKKVYGEYSLSMETLKAVWL